MPEFYHVSRTDISKLSEFSLYDCSGSVSSDTLHTAEEFKTFKLTLHPNGLSKHGENYLHSVYISTGPNMAFTNNEYFLETVLDLVRQLKFPERKSRFISAFGCLTYEDAVSLRNNTFGGVGHIYKVSCENFFKADMSLIRQVASVIGMQLVAEKYWSGETSTNPFWEVLMEMPVKILERID